MRLLLTFLALMALCLPAQAAGKYTVQVGGQTRSFIFEPPEGGLPAPAIIVLSAEGHSAGRMRSIAQFQISKAGWAEIYPQPLHHQWNDGQTDASGKPYSTADDVGFMRAIVARLASEGIVDPKKVYFAGISNGGSMVLRLVCQDPGMVAGAAVVVGGQPKNLDCIDGPPVPMLFIYSKTDALLPFKGGTVREPGGGTRGEVLSTAETLARFALRNHCGYHDQFPIADNFDDGTRVQLRAWRGCVKPLREFVITGAGHTWPGNHNYSRVEKTLGHTSLDISATYEIEAFFKEVLGD